MQIQKTCIENDREYIPEQIKEIFDFSGDAAIVVNSERELCYSNLAFIDLAGLRSSEMTRNITNRKKCYEIVCMKGFCDGNCLAIDSIREKRNINYDLVESYFISNPDKRFILKPSAIPLTGREGNIWGIIEIFRDFTAEENVQRKYQYLLQKERDYSKNLEREVEERTKELKRVNAELVKSQEELVNSVRLASIGEVAGAAAHEILNPINNILVRIEKKNQLLMNEGDYLTVLKAIVTGWKEAFKDGGTHGLIRSLSEVVDAKRGETLLENDLTSLLEIYERLDTKKSADITDYEFLTHETLRVSKIVDRMRTLARSSRDKKRFAARELVRESLILSEDSLKKRNIDVKEEQAEEALFIYADKSELIQVMCNLLKNAMQAIESAHGRGGGIITISTNRANAEVHIKITDDGCGIRDEDRALLFEPGFTTKKEDDGTGIGLSLSRRLLREAGGEIELVDSSSKGTTILIRIPIYKG